MRNKEMILKAIKELESSMSDLYEAISDYEDETGADINNVTGFCENYIFEQDLLSAIWQCRNWKVALEENL